MECLLIPVLVEPRERLGRPFDRGERGAKLVRNRIQEVGLETIEFLELPVGLENLVLCAAILGYVTEQEVGGLTLQIAYCAPTRDSPASIRTWSAFGVPRYRFGALIVLLWASSLTFVDPPPLLPNRNRTAPCADAYGKLMAPCQ